MARSTLEGGRQRAVGPRLVEQLRGARVDRPVVDTGLARGLLAWLEDGLAELALPSSVVVSERSFAPPSALSRVGALRGALVAALLPLHVAGVTVSDPFSAARASLAAGSSNTPLLAELQALDTEERARLAAEVRAHFATMATALGALPSRWSPRVGVRHRVPLHGDRVLCRGTVDLELGTGGGRHASVCVVDVTTAPLDAVHHRRARYLALLETLRTGEQPLRVGVLSTLRGDALVLDVDAELLAEAVSDVLFVIPSAVAA